jgi:hypothetical protein
MKALDELEMPLSTRLINAVSRMSTFVMSNSPIQEDLQENRDDDGGAPRTSGGGAGGGETPASNADGVAVLSVVPHSTSSDPLPALQELEA